MPTWTTETAISELEKLIGEIPALKRVRRHSAEHIRWQTKTMGFLEDVFGADSRYFMTFAHIPWGKSSSFIVGGPGDPQGVLNPAAAIERKHQEAYLQQLDSAKGLLQAALEDLQAKGIEEVYEGKDSAPESSAILRILQLVDRKWRKAVRHTPTSEREVQDVLENLLIGADVEYSRETSSIEYSSKTYTPDFTFQKLDLVLEVKLCSKPEREKKLIPEINDDILAYGTEFGNQIFAVYDLGHIRDVDRFSSHFEDHEGVLVRVVKH